LAGGFRITKAASFLWSEVTILFLDRRSKSLSQHQSPAQPVKLPVMPESRQAIYGLGIGLTIVGLWIGSLIFCLSLNLFHLHPLWTLLLFLWQTFLYTGLFITAHDAMHGAVFSLNRQVNDGIGTVAVFLYALFDYRKLLKKHWQHHQHPASGQDPDFHSLPHDNFWGWYFQFMRAYSGWIQIVGLTLIFQVASVLLHLPRLNLALFWGLPALASSLQLFYFGTFLPHRRPLEGYRDPYRAQSTPFSTVWSFLACYHFGYHWEHHAYPHLAWWQLPQAFRANQQVQVVSPKELLPQR
jgi:beta-carotene/zeaxanthin 4-ketolase